MSRPSPRRLSTLAFRVGAAIPAGVFWIFRKLTRPFPAGCTVLVFMAAFFATGVAGIDFGVHWDEWYHMQGVTGCIHRLSLLPDSLSYGGPYFTLGFPVVLWHQWQNVLGMVHDLRTLPVSVGITALPNVIKFQAEATALVNSSAYVLQIRTVFLGLTSLSILWVFLAVLRCWPRRYGAALAAAAFMAFSWEVGYHARWLAVDAPLTQFCALELLLFCGAWHARGPGAGLRWYCAAAVVSGAVFACKLTGLFAVLPTVITPLLVRGPFTIRARLGRMVLGGTLFVVAAFVLSPEFFLEPLKFLNVLRSGSADYNSAPVTNPHYVGLFEHLWRVLAWFVAVLPSPYLGVALAFSLVALLGLGSMLRRERRMTLTWFTFIATFVLVFTRNHLLVIRQYLMIAPFVALCFARGAIVAWDFLRAKSPRLVPVFALLVVAGFAANATNEISKAWHVTHDTDGSISDDVVKDLLAEKRPVRMSTPVLERLRSRLGTAYTCHPANPADQTVTHFLAYASEHEWMGNRVRAFRHTYGSAEANVDYYTGWLGRMQLSRMEDLWMDQMVSLHRDMKRDVDCFPAPPPPPSDKHG
ncbi:MAG TPA: hypothetical protein VGP07_04430 [Polyangia bacterium]|jgi:hypothetical protein